MLWFLNHFIILNILFCRHVILRLSCSFANEQLWEVDHDSDTFTLIYNINLWVIIFFSFLTLKTNIWIQFGILSSWQLELLAWCCSGEHCCFTASRSRVWSQRLSLVCLHILPVFYGLCCVAMVSIYNSNACIEHKTASSIPYQCECRYGCE